MKISPFWASLALARAPGAIAQATGTSEPSTTTTTAAPSCTASLITNLCDYKDPDLRWAVAVESRPSCWQYCNSHPPCDFVIFNAGNPTTGSGTCWLYPGEAFDKSAGSSDCGSPNLSVYGKPECAGGTPTSGACTATSSPSATASVCGYPAPDDCFNSCAASEGAPQCLSKCVESDSCSYAVFNPGEGNSPYTSGNCWVYTNGTYDAKAATTCSDKPEQFVYENPCPKPPPSVSSNSSTPTATPTKGADAKSATEGSTTVSGSLAPTGLSLSHPLAVGMAVLAVQALQ